MKRIIHLLIALLIVPAVFAEGVTIGVLSPLTGGAAGTGLAQKAGFELALKEINEAGGVLGEDLQIIIEDDKGAEAPSIAAFEKLMTEDNVDFIAGGYASGATLALVESFRTFQPVILWIGGALSGVGIDGFDGIENLLGQEEWFFHVHPWDYQNTEASTQFIVDTGVETVTLLNEDSPFGGPGAAGAQLLLENAGLVVPLREAFKSTLTGGTGDFRATISKAAAANSDMLYWIGYDSDVVPLTSQIRELNFKPRYIFGAPPGWPSEFDSAPEVQCVTGLIGFLPNLPNPEALIFGDAYKDLHGVAPDNYMAALAYASLWAYADAINAAGTKDQDAVIAALQDGEFKSPMGDWHFKPSVEALHQGFGAEMWNVFQFQNGVREIVWPFERATAPLITCSL